jgi:hypothetical protein
MVNPQGGAGVQGSVGPVQGAGSGGEANNVLPTAGQPGDVILTW